MEKLQIIRVNNYEYELIDEREKEYKINIEFLDIEEKPTEGDYIYMSEELLNPKYEEYSTNYTFGDLESKYGKANLSITDVDVIRIIERGEKEIVLKRLYG